MLNLTAHIFIIGGGAQLHEGSDRTLVNSFRVTVVLEEGTDCYRVHSRVGTSNEVSRSVVSRDLRVSGWLAVGEKS